jgi:hypothetical protein
LNSYNQSEKHQLNFKNPDLHYNRAIVHSYLENYNEAYNDLILAHEIDENLKANNVAQNICDLVLHVHKLIKNKCTIKPKKLSQIQNTIPVNLKDGVDFVITSIDALTAGENRNKIISAKAVQAVKKDFEVPL